MSGSIHLKRWVSGEASRSALEWCPEPADRCAITTVFAELAARQGGASFMIVPSRRIAPGEITAAIAAFNSAGGTARICLAGTRADLVPLALAVLDTDHVGLLLDDVDDTASIADLIWDGIEAVRFSPVLVAKAACDLRLSCALGSMLGLAHDLGLCTLGSPAFADGAHIDDRLDFDYRAVPEPESPAAFPRAVAPKASVTVTR